MTGPLDGIVVLSFEHAVAAPLATRQLAELGARVIKIERPNGGDFARHYDGHVRGESSYFVWANRSKQSFAVDVKHPSAGPILERLLEKTDVLVQNLGPGAAARLGLSVKELRPKHEGLITCNVSGYGSSGPYCNKKAYDLLIQAESGLLSITGTPDQVARAGISVADIAAGMHAYSAILAALIQRSRTGKGSDIDISLLDALVEWLGHPLYYAFEGQPQPARMGASHPSIYPYGPFAAGDGHTVILGLQNEREWAVFCAQVLEQPALATDSRFNDNAKRSHNREELRSLIESNFQRLTALQVIARLEQSNIGCARVNDIAHVWTHPQLKARERWVEVQSPVGNIPVLKPPAIVDTYQYQMGPVPALGQHNRDILTELGFTVPEIERLHAEKVVGDQTYVP